MYLRIVVLVWIFNRPLSHAIAPWFLPLGAVAMAVGLVWSRVPSQDPEGPAPAPGVHNPLELKAAFFFAFIFLIMVVATHWATANLGRGGVFSLAALMGVTDVDPFIMGLTQEAGRATSFHVAAVSIVIATACNNVVKGCYAWFFAQNTPRTGRWMFLFLSGLGLLGLVPAFWL